MNTFQLIADSAKLIQEHAAFTQAVNVSYYSVYAIVLILMAAMIVNHMRLKTLFTKALTPFFLLFAIHPAWLMTLIDVNNTFHVIASYVFAGLGVAWFIIFIFITKKPEKPAESKQEDKN